MNAVLLLMGLLVLSYLGSFLVGGRTVRGAGLPSGIEYVALGFVLGPQVLDMVGAGHARRRSSRSCRSPSAGSPSPSASTSGTRASSARASEASRSAPSARC